MNALPSSYSRFVRSCQLPVELLQKEIESMLSVIAKAKKLGI
jgi:hypothetical protein